MVTEIYPLEVSRIVESTPSAIFDIVCDPRMHVEIDGSGMLEATPNSTPVTAVGDTFEMEMDREPLGDLPMGKYKAFNTVPGSSQTLCSNGVWAARSDPRTVTSLDGR